MTNNTCYFDRNISALSVRNPSLCARLSSVNNISNTYRFSESRTGKVIPSIVTGGTTRALHSAFDPEREAERLITSLSENDSGGGSGFFVFLGLGGGFAPEAALRRNTVSGVLIIDYNSAGIAELFRRRDYSFLLGDSRVTLLIDPSPDYVKEAVLELYRPAICGSISILPLRTRTETDKNNFTAAGEAAQKAVEILSADYSVQAYFGLRWFSNIIRNIAAEQRRQRPYPPVPSITGEAAICAAGPSLNDQIPLLLEKRAIAGKSVEKNKSIFIISSDTALQALLKNGLKPDVVVSIDCQHISYNHFAGINCSNIPLFLDLASPPMLAEFSQYPFFFSGGHPLTIYSSHKWRRLPQLDTSGCNVTHACLSLAEKLGAGYITVYGADFSYPSGIIYAKGTYIFPSFERKQERFRPIESQAAALLYRSPFLPAEGKEGHCYETTALRLYRKSFEQKALAMEAHIRAVSGRGVPIVLTGKKIPSDNRNTNTAGFFTQAKEITGAKEFLLQYMQDIKNLPVYGGSGGAYFEKLRTEEKNIFVTLLPQAAAIQRRRSLRNAELIEAVKAVSVQAIEQVLNSTL